MIGRFLRAVVLLVMFALGALLCILGLGLQNHTTLFVTAMIAWLVLALGALTAGSKAGKTVLSAASLTLALIFVQRQFPGFWAGAHALLGRADASARKIATESTRRTPSQIPCDTSRRPGGAFFDAKTGDPLVWYRIDENGAIECYDGPGFHPLTRDELKPISPDIVRRVIEGPSRPGRLQQP